MREYPKKISRVCCIGAGYVGGPTMAVIAKNCPNIIVNVVDINEERIRGWNSSDLKKLPIFEPGLDKVIKVTRGKNLFFSTEISKEIELSDLIFLCVNTPTKDRGVGAGKAIDLKWVEICAREIAKFSKGHTIVVEKSTVAVRTADVLENILNANSQKKSFSVLSNPEFLSEGTAIEDLQNPDRVLIGGVDEKAMDLLKEIYMCWVNEKKILKTNIWSSELSKLTSNAFLAQRISSINSISALCEKTGADIDEVSKSIGADNRLGEDFLKAGPGFGGSCFQKDILNLVYLCEFFNLPEVSNYWENVLSINNWQKNRISKLIVEKLFGTLNGKKIAILGFSFKANTNDTRESAAIKICLNLLEEGAYLCIHDPKVTKNQIENEFKIQEMENSSFGIKSSWKYSETIDDAIQDANAVLILTEWGEYKSINWKEKEAIMSSPAWIFDTRSVTEEKSLSKTNLNYWRLGNIIKTTI